uniref:PPPDE domain-containing protein n=1 Tax=Arundo donax TaxID=35708 RepID=A0A0A9CHX3_ARUDO
MGQEVVAHIYDVANAGSDATVLHINRFFKDAIGLGGIFHTAIQVYGDEEWSFGFCERGTGVFSCPPSKNPMYTFRESIVLGNTNCSIFTVNQILRELSWEWPGGSYELLSRNCNHFCNTFCEKLDVPKLPGWVNRFANAGDAALEVAETTAVKVYNQGFSASFMFSLDNFPIICSTLGI